MKHQNKDIYSQYKEKVNNGIIVTSLGALLLISVLKKEILIINQPLQREVLPIITAAGFIVSLIGLVMLFKNKSRLCRLEAAPITLKSKKPITRKPEPIRKANRPRRPPGKAVREIIPVTPTITVYPAGKSFGSTADRAGFRLPVPYAATALP